MRTVYLDESFMCHLNDDGNCHPWETDMFDSMCGGAIECYRHITEGETWTNPKGRVYYGPFTQAVMLPDAIQYQYEVDKMQMQEMIGELEDALCEQDTANEERWAEIEDALCELDRE